MQTGSEDAWAKQGTRRCAAECNPVREYARRVDAVSIDELFKAGHALTSAEGMIFRGMPNVDYRLHSTFDRALEDVADRSATARHLEEVMVRKFAREAHLRLDDPPAQEAVMEWLAVMQHYAAPTRLVDWTYSFWTALFFAAVSGTDGEGCVWVLDERWAQRAADKIASERAPTGFEAQRSDLHAREKGTFYELYVKPSVRFVMKQNCWRQNPRLVAQRGVFLCPGGIEWCFQSNLAALFEAHPALAGRERLRRISFRRCERASILGRLDKMGISYATLYPDIEGLARSLHALPMMEWLHAGSLEMSGIDGPPPRRSTSF